jgi:peptide/nickel transport system permease protein
VLESAENVQTATGGPGATVPGASTVDEAPAAAERRRLLSIGGWLAAGWLTFVMAAGTLAPLLPLKHPLGRGGDANFGAAGDGWFTAGHPFGLDEGGRDILSRVIWGGRASLIIAVGSILLGTIVGAFLGLVAGYVGGKTDTILSSSFNILLAFPQLILAMTLVAVLAPATDENPVTWWERIRVMILAIGLVSVPIIARITRANTLTWSRREFVMAARAQGARSISVMFREVLPNVLPAIVSIAMLGVAVVIVIEGGLALFGVSVSRPEPSWGNMIAAEIGTVEKQPHVWQAPAAFIFLTVLSLNYLGDVIRARFDVRESAL